MNENLNLVEILKDCPEGTKLYSPTYGDVELVNVSQDKGTLYPITIKIPSNSTGTFTCERCFDKDGRIFADYSGECLLFPNRNQRDWGKFKPKKPKFDPKTLQPFDKVLVRTGTESYHLWYPDFISLPPNEVDETILCMTIDTDIIMVVPYNEETKQLVGTNKEAPEFYRYWDD